MQFGAVETPKKGKKKKKKAKKYRYSSPFDSDVGIIS